MAYREAMMTDARKWGEAVFSGSIRMLEAEYQKTDRRDAVLQAFAELFGQWEEHTRKEAACLGVCYLHSSILMRTGGIRLALFGKEFYMDENQLEKTWQPPCFFQQYEQDISAVMDKLRKEYPRIYPYEENAVRFWYAEYYYAALETLCRDMLGEIREIREYCMLNKTEDFFIFFGRWRGEAEKLACIEDI